MSDQESNGKRPPSAAAVRFGTLGAVAGVVLGAALIALLRKTLGPTEHYFVKSVAILFIVGAFGAFVGLLAEAFLRSRHG